MNKNGQNKDKMAGVEYSRRGFVRRILCSGGLKWVGIVRNGVMTPELRLMRKNVCVEGIKKGNI